MSIAVLIPAYNEEATIRNVLEEFSGQLPEARLFVIDNNSSDRTNAIASGWFEQKKNKGRVIFEPHQGKANAIRRGFIDVEADIYVMVDADLTYPACEVQRLIEPVVRGEADIVVGDRLSGGTYFKENRGNFHGFGNRLVKILINFFFRAGLKDIMSGYRVLSRKFVRNYPVMTEGFEIETEMTLHALDKRFRIVEIPIEYKGRPEGSSSKLNTFRDGLRVLKTLFWILKDYRPLGFFLCLSLFFFGAGFLVGLPVLIEFAETHFIKHVPFAILATGLMILSMISFAVALILDTVVRIHKFDYELHLKQLQ